MAVAAATRVDVVKSFIGDLARPFAVYVTSSASAYGIVVIARNVENGNDGAIFVGAVGVLIGLLIGAKAVENINAARNKRDVDVATVNAAPPIEEPKP